MEGLGCADRHERDQFMSKFLGVLLVSACLVLVPLRGGAEPITLTILGIKAALAFLGGKAAIAYGVTKFVVVKGGLVVMKKTTVMLPSGAAVGVVAFSAAAFKATLAEAGVTGLTDDTVKILAPEVLADYEAGHKSYRVNACRSLTDGKILVLPRGASCGEMRPVAMSLELGKFVTFER